MNKLAQVIDARKWMAKELIPFSHPKAGPNVEQDILFFKQSFITVDGYDAFVVLSYNDYDEYILESLQIHSMQAAFLPFTIVAKLGRLFLGETHLSYTEFSRSGKIVYCWTVKRIDEKTVASLSEAGRREFEGFRFSILSPGIVTIR